MEVLIYVLSENRNAGPSHQHSRKRRGPYKKSKYELDIMTVFLELPPHVTPSYIAKDISNCPPLDINCFDISTLVKDIEALKFMFRSFTSRIECF